MQPNLETHYFCLEHGIWYKKDDYSMCPVCENELCGEHDSELEER